MGSKTWIDPLMPWPLPNRINILATSRKEEFPGADKYICGDLNAELKTLKKENADKTIWVIGGPNIIEQTIETIETKSIGKQRKQQHSSSWRIRHFEYQDF
jgi:dihydrofolate reductase